jgi:hypothetical protein
LWYRFEILNQLVVINKKDMMLTTIRLEEEIAGEVFLTIRRKQVPENKDINLIYLYVFNIL